MRERLLDRRLTETFDLDVLLPSGAVQTYVVSLGHYTDGRLGEVFLDAGKAGSDMEVATREIALAISFALQNGCSVDEMRNSCPRREDGTPEGIMGVLLDHLHEREQGIGADKLYKAADQMRRMAVISGGKA